MISAQRNLKEWRENPKKFVWDQFKATPDKWQEDVLDAFASGDADKQRICLRACAGPGKSTVMVWCGWNFLSCYAEPGEHPKGAAMSITAENLKNNMWAEFAKWQGRSAYLRDSFTWTSEKIYCNQYPETWFISARSFPKTANAEEQGRTLSGLHAKFVLYLIDESGDISPNVLRSADQGLSTKPAFGKIMQAGNPTSQSGCLYAAATILKNQWFTVRITGDPDDPKRSPRIDINWAKQQIAQYGRDNPWVMAYLLGEFPPGGINTLLGVEEVEGAMGKHLTEDQYDWAQKRLGVDVARFGDDRTILFPRQGLASFKWVEMRNARSNDIAARVLLARKNWEQEIDYVDGSGGWGSGVVDSLLLAKTSPREVNFGGKATDPRYFNKRSEMWFQMAEWIRRGGALYQDTQLARELTTPTYTLHGGKFRLEEKEQIKSRLGFSPDIADACALTFADPDQPGIRRLPGGYVIGGHQHEVVYDPYSNDRLKT